MIGISYQDAVPGKHRLQFFDAFYDLNRLVDGLKDVPLCMQDSLLPSSRWKAGITDMTWQLSLIATTPKDEK